ncbi:unnamed protein product [Mesocestoides corti]|uniref:1-deoxy-D-xylulose-5-phosphate reductoisomerase n=1 Tax=Mesocestoides corti TaxID=53468 RepID=A0A0R3U4E1_MESCO|nr:unnamed protein product [Mesocestoides corti]
MAEQLAKSGLFVDDLNKLRIIDPSITQATIDFKEECPYTNIKGVINSLD